MDFNQLIEIDSNLSLWLYRWGNTQPIVQKLALGWASSFIYLLPVLLLFLFFRSRQDRLNSVKIFLTALVSWKVLALLIGTWLYTSYGFRDRPFSQDGIVELFFERPEKAFPSDHSAVMFAVMLAFFHFRYPFLGWVFLIGGTVSALGRVIVGFHFIGDVFAGWLVGLGGFYLIKLLEKPIETITQRLTAWLPVQAKQDEQNRS